MLLVHDYCWISDFVSLKIKLTLASAAWCAIGDKTDVIGRQDRAFHLSFFRSLARPPAIGKQEIRYQ